MPNHTFYNLKKEKKDKVIKACKKEFNLRTIDEASVSNIVKDLNIARGSFYQYFDNLEDCYFYLLSQETIEVHEVLNKVLVDSNFNLINALENYKDYICKELYKKDTYNLYRNRYSHWTSILQNKWGSYKKKNNIKNNNQGHLFNKISLDNLNINNLEELREFMFYLKSIIHSLIERLYVENWSEDEFKTHYDIYLKLIIDGLKK